VINLWPNNKTILDVLCTIEAKLTIDGRSIARPLCNSTAIGLLVLTAGGLDYVVYSWRIISAESGVPNDGLDTGIELQQPAAAAARRTVNTCRWPVDAQRSPLSISVRERRLQRRRRRPSQSTPRQVSALRRHCYCCCGVRAAIRRLLVTVRQPSPAQRRHPTARQFVGARLPEGHVDSDGVQIIGKSPSAQLQQLVLSWMPVLI